MRGEDEIVLPSNVPRGGEIEARARRELAGYYAHIEATDRAIGRLLADVPRKTLVVFTSVHGDMHGAHGLFRKGWPHEESVRVPLLVRRAEIGSRKPEAGSQRPEDGSRKSEAGNQRREDEGQRTEIRGERSEAAISLVDLPELMRAEIENRKPRMQGQFARISMPSVVRLPDQCDRAWRGVRTPRRKLVLNAESMAGPARATEPWLFFDLENDPLELRNLAREAARTKEIEELRALAAI